MSTSPPSPPTPSPLSVLADIESPKVCLFSLCPPTVVNGDKLEVEEPYDDKGEEPDDDRVEDVYVFDLDDPDSIPVSPALRFRTNSYLARCVINLRLYLFEGGVMEPEEKSVHVYDLSSYSSSQLSAQPKIVHLNMMKELPPMIGLKSFPRAIPTPDKRKILVFSTVIAQANLYERDYTDGAEMDKHFELFDYTNERWEELPPFPQLYSASGHGSITIVSYYFMNDSTFVIHMDQPNSFALHLNVDDESPAPYWSRYGESRALSGGMVHAFGGSLSVWSLGFYNGKEEEDYEKDCWLMTGADHHYGRRRCDGEEGVVGVCFLYIKFDYDLDSDGKYTAMYPRVCIDVHEVGLASVGGIGDADAPAPRKTRSYEFKVGIPYWYFLLVDVLPVVYSGSRRSGLLV